MATEQKAQVEKVLGELDSLSKPRIEVLNKIDLLPEDERVALLSRTNASPKVESAPESARRSRYPRSPAKASRLCSQPSMPRSTPTPSSMPSCAFRSTRARFSPPSKQA